MASWKLAVGLAFAAASSIMFFIAGRVQQKRSAMGDARLALQLFAVWWYAIAATTVSGAVFTLLANAGVIDVALWEVYTYLAVGLICLALFGLLYYLLYLFTGQRAWLRILAVFYVIYYFTLIYWVQVSDPIAVKAGDWNAEIEYAHMPGGVFFGFVLFLLIAPQILAGLAYFTLYFRVKERAQRYRIFIVSWSIIVWFSSSLLALIPRVQDSDAWAIIQRSIGLVAAGLIVMAYRPPSRIQRWLDAPLEEKSGETKRAKGSAPLRRTHPWATLAMDLFRPRPVPALF